MLVPTLMTHTMSKAQIISLWSEGTDAEIIDILKKHYDGELDLREYWSVGDTRRVKLSSMQATGVGESHEEQYVDLVITEVGGKLFDDGETECLFQIDQKDCLLELGYINSTATNTGGWKECARRTWCNSVYYNAIPNTLRPIFKQFINQSGLGGGSTSGVENTTDYFALRAEVEIYNVSQKSVSGEGSCIEYYKTTSNRTKNKDGIDCTYWLRSPGLNATNFCNKSYGSSSSASVSAPTNTFGIAPFGVI